MTEQNLGKDFETLLGMLRPEESVNKEDIRILKEQIFGPNVFWVTGTRTTDDVLDGGIVVSQSQSLKTKGTNMMLYLLTMLAIYTSLVFLVTSLWEAESIQGI